MRQIVTHEFSGRLWPNGQFGIARCKELSLSSAKVRMDAPRVSKWALCVAVHGVSATCDFIRERDEYLHPERGLCSVPDSVRDSGVSSSPFGSSHLTNSHRRGEKGITAHGRKLVRCAAKGLQDRFGRGCLSFLTLTIPGMSSENLAAIASNWSEVVRVFCQRLKRALLRAGLDGEIVGVTEVQEKRVLSGGGYALHLHLLFQGASIRYQWKYPPVFYREMWASVLELYVPRDEWSDDRALENVKCVKFSCEGYLGKYMSKGVESLARVKEVCPDAVIPSSWYVCTMRLRRSVLRSICYVNSISARYLVDLIDSCPDVFEYCKPVKVSFGGREIGVGYAGKLRPDRFEEVRETLYALKETRLSEVSLAW